MFFSNNFIFLLLFIYLFLNPCALAITPCWNCNFSTAAFDWLTCECAITSIAATSSTDRSISHTLGSEFQKNSRPGCIQQSDESLLIFPQVPEDRKDSSHWLLSRHQTSAFIIRLAAFLPTPLNQSLVYRTQILEAKLVERSGWDVVVRKRGLVTPDVFGQVFLKIGHKQESLCLYNNLHSSPHTQNQTHMLILALYALLCNFCAKLCQRGNNYLIVTCFESSGMFKTGWPPQPLRPGCQESPSSAPVELRNL